MLNNGGKSRRCPRAPPSRAEGALPMAALPSGLPPVLRRRPNPQPALRPRRAGGKRGLSPRTLVASGLHGPGARLRPRSRLGKDGQRRPRLQSVVRSTRTRGSWGPGGWPRPSAHAWGCGVGGAAFWRVNTCLARETGTGTQKLTRAAPLPQEPLHSPDLPFFD